MIMLKPLLPLLFIIFFVPTKTLSQCVITTTETSTNWGSSLGPGVTTVHSHGQQIKVCEGGTVTSLAMSRATVLNVNTTGKLELYRSSTSFSNLVWTVDGFPVDQGFNYVGPNWHTIDLTSGSGTNYTLDPNEVVTLRFHRINNMSYSFHYNSTNPYQDGMLVTGQYQPYSGGNWDWIMKIAMNGASLPVDYLRELWCKPKNNIVILAWVTVNEINNLGYDVERSKDGITFENIGWVDGFGSETGPFTYTFTDNFPLTGRNYYRLKQQDYDGRFDYSHITHIDVKKNGDVQIYPNPVADKLYISGTDKDSTYSITDINGRIISQGTITDEYIDVYGLKAGSYVLSVDNGDIVSHHRMVKVE